MAEEESLEQSVPQLFGEADDVPALQKPSRHPRMWLDLTSLSVLCSTWLPALQQEALVRLHSEISMVEGGWKRAVSIRELFQGPSRP